MKVIFLPQVEPPVSKGEQDLEVIWLGEGGKEN